MKEGQDFLPKDHKKKKKKLEKTLISLTSLCQ